MIVERDTLRRGGRDLHRRADVVDRNGRRGGGARVIRGRSRVLDPAQLIWLADAEPTAVVNAMSWIVIPSAPARAANARQFRRDSRRRPSAHPAVRAAASSRPPRSATHAHGVSSLSVAVSALLTVSAVVPYVEGAGGAGETGGGVSVVAGGVVVAGGGPPVVGGWGVMSGRHAYPGGVGSQPSWTLHYACCAALRSG